jgi:hypothetical protein
MGENFKKSKFETLEDFELRDDLVRMGQVQCDLRCRAQNADSNGFGKQRTF